MRRQRSIHKTFGFLAVVLGVVTAPAVARAGSSEDTTATTSVPADASDVPTSTPPPDRDPPPPPAEEQPTVPPTTAPPADVEPPATAPSTDPAVTAPERAAQPAPPTTPPSATSPSTPAADEAAPSPEGESDADEPAGVTGIAREIAFPVLGPVRYSDDFGACRDACARHHKGNDMIGVRMQPLLAAVDGTVTRISLENEGISGVSIRITGDDGWYYGYYHVNNDTPGTDDGRATPEWQVEPGLTVGSRVRAGQIIGYMGDSGNAELSVPHLHFEIRMPDRTPVDPWLSLVAAQRRESCTAGTDAWTSSPLEELSPAAVAVIPLADGGRWVIDADGRLHAEGPAALIQRATGADCSSVVTPAPAEASPIPAPADISPADAPAALSPVDEPAVAPTVPPVEEPASSEGRWTVAPGDSLWRIVRRAYGVSDTTSTAALVGFVFEQNRDQLDDPSDLVVGTQLVLPPLQF